MLERSTGLPGADNGVAKDCENRAGAGGTALLPRSNQDNNDVTRATVARPMAIHGAVVCAFHRAGAAAAVRGVPQ